MAAFENSPPEEKDLRPDPETTEGRFFRADLELLQTGYFSDAELVCKDRKWKVHKGIICSRSDYFMKAFTNGMAETSANSMTIMDREPEHIDVLLKYIYGGVLDVEAANQVDKSYFATYIRLYEMSEFFFVKGMGLEAIRASERYCSEKIATLCRITCIPRRARDTATSRNGPGVKWVRVDDQLWDELLAGIRLAYTFDVDWANQFKKMLANFVHAGRFNLLYDERFDALIGELPEFCVAIMRSMASKDPDRFTGGREERPVLRREWTCYLCGKALEMKKDGIYNPSNTRAGREFACADCVGNPRYDPDWIVEDGDWS